MSATMRRFGIRARLFLAFGSVAAMTVVACVAAWLSYARLGGSLEEMSGVHMPALELATRLAEESGSIRVLAPLLTAAMAEPEYRAARQELRRHLVAMRALLARIAASESAALGQPGLTELVDALEAKLDQLDDNARLRFQLAQQNREAMARLRWLQADFVDEAEPLVEDARFNIRLAIDALDRGGEQDAALRLREEIGKAEAVLIANANANLLLGLLSRAATLASATDLEAARHFLDETADLLQQNAVVLEAWPDMVTLRQLMAQLLELASTEHGLPALRQQELAAQQHGQALLEQTQALVYRLNIEIASRIGQVGQAAAAAAERSGQDIAFGRRLLLLLAMASLAVALAVAWAYVHRNLLRRLTELGTAARAIAAGDLRTPVPISGDDEITEMAEALLVFRDTAIQVEKANAQAIINNAVAGLLTTDEQGVIEFVNPVAEGLLAGSEGRLQERLPAVDGARVAAFFKQVLSGAIADEAAVFMLETTGRRSDGAPVPLAMGIRPFRQRRRRGFIVTITDITERREAQRLLEQKVAERTADLTRTNERLEQEIQERRRTERELREAQAELIQAAKLAALGKVATGVAHELNQPLAAIRSYAHNARLLLKAERFGEVDQNLAKISDLTARMADISNHLKRFARRPATQLRPVEFAPVVERALALFELRLRDEDVEVIRDLPPGLRVLAEEIRLEQVVVNLISNALDAMRGRSRRQLKITARVTDDDKVRIHVADSGDGIAEEQLPLIFDPFYTSKEVGAGLGLGLPISYNIVKDLGGSLSVAATGPDGTVFQLLLDHA